MADWRWYRQRREQRFVPRACHIRWHRGQGPWRGVVGGKAAPAFGLQKARVEAVSDLDAVFDGMDLKGAINLVEIMVDKNAFPNYRSRR